MNSKECEEQLKRLIYDWETEGLLTKINATDIEAIKHLMLENQIQQDDFKCANEEIKRLKDRIDKVIEYIDYYVRIDDEHYDVLKEILKEDNKEKVDE